MKWPCKCNGSLVGFKQSSHADLSSTLICSACIVSLCREMAIQTWSLQTVSSSFAIQYLSASAPAAVSGELQTSLQRVVLLDTLAEHEVTLLQAASTLSSLVSLTLSGVSRSAGTTSCNGRSYQVISGSLALSATDQLTSPYSRYSRAVTLPLELTAAAFTIGFWDSEGTINIAVWITIFAVVIIILNVFGTWGFAEEEFWSSCLKLIVIIMFLISALVFVLGGGPKSGQYGEYWGARLWHNPGALANVSSLARHWRSIL